MDGRRNPEGNQRYAITKIWDSHQEIARMLALGFKPARIAQELGVTTQTVSNVRNNPLVAARLKQLQSLRDASVVDVRRQVMELVPDAIETIAGVMEDENSKNSDRLRAALGVLDHTLPKQSHSTSVEAVVTSEDIDKITGRIKIEEQI